MRLYKAELYKLLHKKFFLTGTVIAMAIFLLFFWFVEVGEERSSVDGNIYKGYAAIKQDKKITKEVEGILSDDKVLYIVEKYGFPQVVEENYQGFRDSNYLNNFVAHYLSDGYMMDWNHYKVATKVKPLAETDIGKMTEITEEDVPFSYAKGWKVFLEVFQMGMVLGSILIILGISVVFSDESQTGMLQIIFTTEEGKNKDIRAKVLAAFTLAFGIYGVIVVSALLICSVVYGMKGINMPIGLVTYNLNLNNQVTHMPAIKFVILVMLFSLVAVLTLCAVTLWVSAHFTNSFHSVVMSLGCWGIPVLIRMFFGGFAYILAAGTPVFLIMTTTTWDIYSIWFLPVSFALFVLVFCVIMGYKTYSRLHWY